MANTETETLAHPDAPTDRYSLRDQIAAALGELSGRRKDISIEMSRLMDKVVASREAIGGFCAEVGEGNRRIVILKHYDHDEANIFTHFFLSVYGPMAIKVKYPPQPSKEGFIGMIRMNQLDKVHRLHLVPLINDLCEGEGRELQNQSSSLGLTTDGYSYILSLPPLSGKSGGKDLVITNDHGQNPRIVPATENQFVRALFESMYHLREK